MSIPAIKAVGIGRGPARRVAPRVAHPRRDPAACRRPAGRPRPRRPADQQRRRPRGRRDQRRGSPRHRLHEADRHAHEAAALGRPDDDDRESPAAIERSDVCAVPAAAVVGEAMVAIVLADAASRSSAATRSTSSSRTGRRSRSRPHGPSRDATLRDDAGDHRPRRLDVTRASGCRAANELQTSTGASSTRHDSPDPQVRRRHAARAGAARRRHHPRYRSADRRHDRDDVCGAGHRAGGAAGRRARCGSSSSTSRWAATRRPDRDDQSRVRRARRDAARGGRLPERARTSTRPSCGRRASSSRASTARRRAASGKARASSPAPSSTRWITSTARSSSIACAASSAT